MSKQITVLPEHAVHPRTYDENRYVYPVLSRRSGGISIGINLNPDKRCNFDCVYCQVDRTTGGGPKTDRTTAGGPKGIDVARLLDELAWTVERVTGGELFADARFRNVPAPLRRLRDIAFSGDGEPTTAREFPQVVQQVAAFSPRLEDIKLVLITNATRFHRPGVLRAVDVLMRHRGEIWAKLEAGTEEYYRRIERTTIPFDRVLANIARVARRHPLVIQSLFMRLEQQPPPAAEIEAYIDRLAALTEGGGRLARIQVYTVARSPAEHWVTPLAPAELDAIASRVRERLAVPVEVHYGPEGC